MADIDKSLPNEIRTELEVPGAGEEVQVQEEVTEKGPRRSHTRRRWWSNN